MVEGGATVRGNTTTSPSLVRSSQGSPSASRQVNGGKVISFSPGYYSNPRGPKVAPAVSWPLLAKHEGGGRLPASIEIIQ
jgi:hypothetical protein